MTVTDERATTKSLSASDTTAFSAVVAALRVAIPPLVTHRRLPVAGSIPVDARYRQPFPYRSTVPDIATPVRVVATKARLFVVRNRVIHEGWIATSLQLQGCPGRGLNPHAPKSRGV